MRTKSLMLVFLTILLLVGRTVFVSSPAEASQGEGAGVSSVLPAAAYSALTVALRTPTDESIEFIPSGRIDKITRKSNTVPHLVLNRNGSPTPSFERTLEVTVNNVPVSPPGSYVELAIGTQHSDPDLGKREDNHIEIWKETAFVPQSSVKEGYASLHFTVTFDAHTNLHNKVIVTPTDYFQYQISILDMHGNKQYSHIEEYAFLMENQWRVPLPKVLESSPGAAPDRLLVYYYDMLPFQVDPSDATTRMSRQNVEQYLQTELLPAMVEGFRTQSSMWEFPWHAEWRNFRRDEDPKTLSVALIDADTWFHGEPPSLGHSMISIRVDGSFDEYETLTDGILSVFYHELFHNHQRNISLHFNGHAQIAGKENAWMMFSEGTAVLASSVGLPTVQFSETAQSRSYMKRANAFVGGDAVVGGGLNKSYTRIPYQTAAYWRFLYEKCGGLNNGKEDPAMGMQVIRTTLETLYMGGLVDIGSSTDLIDSLPIIMDRVLANSPVCPFHSYEESLSAFARAIYQLRLGNGRCIVSGWPVECGFFDPHRLYSIPPVESTVTLQEARMTVNGKIPASYGIDFIDLHPGLAVNGKLLRIHFSGADDSASEFRIQVLKIAGQGVGADPSTAFVSLQDVASMKTTDGELQIDIRGIHSTEDLILIIIRQDPYEQDDPSGTYSIQFVME